MECSEIWLNTEVERSRYKRHESRENTNISFDLARRRYDESSVVDGKTQQEAIADDSISVNRVRRHLDNRYFQLDNLSKSVRESFDESSSYSSDSDIYEVDSEYLANYFDNITYIDLSGEQFDMYLCNENIKYPRTSTPLPHISYSDLMSESEDDTTESLTDFFGNQSSISLDLSDGWISLDDVKNPRTSTPVPRFGNDYLEDGQDSLSNYFGNLSSIHVSFSNYNIFSSEERNSETTNHSPRPLDNNIFSSEERHSETTNHSSRPLDNNISASMEDPAQCMILEDAPPLVKMAEPSTGNPSYGIISRLLKRLDDMRDDSGERSITHNTDECSTETDSEDYIDMIEAESEDEVEDTFCIFSAFYH